MQDEQLLRDAAAGSRQALARIARRYVDFVYHAALRQVGDRHLAEDVTQAVFVILSGKVHRIKPGTILHSWMFTTTRYAARNALKMRARRIHHERLAASLRSELPDRAKTESEFRPLLDMALAELREVDRCAVLLSFFGKKSWRDVGAAIGISEEAARKRVDRSLARLRKFFARRGIEVTAAALATTMAASAEAGAPPAVLHSLTTHLLEAPLSGGTAGIIAKEVLHMYTAMKLKFAAAACAALMALGGIGVAMVRLEDASPARQQEVFAAHLENDVVVELAGVSKIANDNQMWWNPDGSASAARFELPDSRDEPPLTHALALRTTGEDIGVQWQIENSDGWSEHLSPNAGGDETHVISFRAKGDAASMRVSVASSPFQTVATKEQMDTVSAHDIEGGKYAVAFTQCIDSPDGARVSITDDLLDHQTRIVAVADGKEHGAISKNVLLTKNFRVTTVCFDLPTQGIDHIDVQARRFDQWVEFRNISLEPGKNKGFKVTSGKTEPARPGK